MPRAKPRGKISRPGLRASPRKRNPEISDVNSDDNKNEDITINDEEMDEETGKGSGDTSQSDTNEPMDSKGEDDESSSTGHRKRGRKRKSEIPQEEKYVPTQDPTQRGIMAQGGSLRRRDTLKPSWRYSPPPVATRRIKGDDNKITKMDNRKKLAIMKSQPAILLDDKNQSDMNDDKKMIVNMPDGFPIKVEPPKKKITITTNTSPKVATTAAKPKTVVIVDTPTVKATDKDSSITAIVEDVSQDNEVEIIDKVSEKNDKTNETTEQPPTARGARVAARRKSAEPVVAVTTTSVTATTIASVTETSKSPVKVTLTSAGSAEKTAAVVVTRSSSAMHHPIGMSKTQTITISTNTPPITVTTTKNQVSNTSTTSVTTAPSVTTTTTTTATGSVKVPTILKPTITATQVANVSNVSKGPPIKKPVSLSKYLDTLPEIEDCIHNDGIQDVHMEKLPDKILLVHSELPLPLAISVDKEEENYLFR